MKTSAATPPSSSALKRPNTPRRRPQATRRNSLRNRNASVWPTSATCCSTQTNSSTCLGQKRTTETLRHGEDEKQILSVSQCLRGSSHSLILRTEKSAHALAFGVF